MAEPLSRRGFLVASAAVAAGLAYPLRAWTMQTPAPQAPTWKPVFTPLRRGVGYFTASGGTIGYLVNDAGVIVVDSQFVDPARAFLAGLAQQTGRTRVDILLNTHHHADHTGGNTAFREVTRSIVAHTRVPALQKADNDAAATPLPQAYADATFSEIWNHGAGDEMVRGRVFTPAHTGGDIVVYFEKANVVHVGDLVWNSLQTFVDRKREGSAVNWITVCERIADTYPADAVYLCGHAKRDLPVAIGRTEVLAMRDYLTALVDHVRQEIKAGKSRDEVITSTALLEHFEARGPLTKRALEGTYDELAAR